MTAPYIDLESVGLTEVYYKDLRLSDEGDRRTYVHIAPMSITRNSESCYFLLKSSRGLITL